MFWTTFTCLSLVTFTQRLQGKSESAVPAAAFKEPLGAISSSIGLRFLVLCEQAMTSCNELTKDVIQLVITYNYENSVKAYQIMPADLQYYGDGWSDEDKEKKKYSYYP